MALNARKIKSESKFERPPALDAGAYPARIIQVIDLGVQKQRAYKGEEKTPKPMLYVTYEFADEFLLDEDGNELEDKPRWLSEDFPMYSLEADLAKSTKRYLAIDPEMKFDGDWSQLIGAPIMVTITRSPSAKDASVIFNNVASLSTMRAKEAVKMPDLVNEGKVFDMGDPDINTFMSLPKWLQDKMKENLDYTGSDLEDLVEGYQEGSSGGSSKKEEKGTEKGVESSSEVSEDDGDW